MRQRPTPLQHIHSYSCAYAHEFVCMLVCAQPVFQVCYCYSQSYHRFTPPITKKTPCMEETATLHEAMVKHGMGLLVSGPGVISEFQMLYPILL